jgi:rare lipoprotein A
MLRKALLIACTGSLLATATAAGQSFLCEEQFPLSEELMACHRQGPELPVTPPKPAVVEEQSAVFDTPAVADPTLAQRLRKYAQYALDRKAKVAGLASYYSSFFDGRKTANGEIFRNGEFSAAHLALPLGSWIEVKSRATGRKLRLRVNDRGPYAPKFFLDLSQAAARFLGVDSARDRYVEVRVIALPGEKPLPEGSTPAAEAMQALLAASIPAHQ